MKRWMHSMMAFVVVSAAACGSDVSSPIELETSTTRGTSSAGTDSSGGNTGGNTGGKTSNGPVASVEVLPATLSLPAGYYRGLVAIGRDAAGVVVANTRATWISSNSAIVAVVGDTGVIQAKAVGVAVVTATIDGKSAATTITVTQAPPPTSTPNQPQPAVEFNMNVTVVGQLAGTDTSKTERVPGATVSLIRTGGIGGDTLASPVDAGSAVADANGQAKFAKLPGGFYTIRVTPPAGSVYTTGTMGIGRPSDADINVTVKVQRK